MFYRNQKDRFATIIFNLFFLIAGIRSVSAIEWQQAPAPQPGDTVMFVAPAGDVTSQEEVDLAKKRLIDAGYKVLIPENLVRQRGYLAGTDQERADELMSAFTNSDVDAIFCYTGGFGVTRMLHLLDFDKIKANPKIVVGFSDITGIHAALAAKANLISFHGPNVDSGWSKPNNLPLMISDSLLRTLGGNTDAGYFFPMPEGHSLEVLNIGQEVRTSGRLVGGNLTLVCTLMGTPFEINTEDNILFIEDIGEAPYRIDRYLSQLRLAGKLDKLAGVILGQFTDCEAKDDPTSLTLDQILADYFQAAPYPVIANFPAGHVRNNMPIPLGAKVEISTDPPSVMLLQNPVVK